MQPNLNSPTPASAATAAAQGAAPWRMPAESKQGLGLQVESLGVRGLLFGVERLCERIQVVVRKRTTGSVPRAQMRMRCGQLKLQALACASSP